MTLIVFIIVLGVLVLVHELGHFLAAKKAGVHVEEFGFGYPPRALTLGKRWGTIFSLNWIPFGGFVKILGENYESTENSSETVSKNFRFTQISKKWQAAILAGGVIFNILFAWILFSISFMAGVASPIENDFGGVVKNPKLTVVGIMPNSPAHGILKAGDQIESVFVDNQNFSNLNPDLISGYINNSTGSIKLDIKRGSEKYNFSITPSTELVPDKKIIGISMDMVGTLTLPPHKAFYQGAVTTIKISYLTVAGVLGLIRDAVVGKADISQVTGPVGIVGLVGDATRLGFTYLVTFTALISINLAVINLLPFPALDGGRLLFVAYEALTKRQVNIKFAVIANTVGFALLISLMVFITYRDILKIL